MTNKSHGVDQKLQFTDELTDVVQLYQKKGGTAAKASFEKTLAKHLSQWIQDTRLIFLVSMTDAFVKGTLQLTALELADLLNKVEVTIAGVETDA
jgi:hypothetical protein